MNYKTKKNLISMVGLYIVIVILFTIWTIYGIKNTRDIIPQETTTVRNFRTTETTTEATTEAEIKTETTTKRKAAPVVRNNRTTHTEATQTDALKYLGVFKVTAYCPCRSCSGGFGSNTSTGTRATAGRTIAVDPSIIPYGTKVIINGHKYIAEDCGGAVKGRVIDIFFDTHAEVEAFGRQRLNVYIERGETE